MNVAFAIAELCRNSDKFLKQKLLKMRSKNISIDIYESNYEDIEEYHLEYEENDNLSVTAVDAKNTIKESFAHLEIKKNRKLILPAESHRKVCEICGKSIVAKHIATHIKLHDKPDYKTKFTCKSECKKGLWLRKWLILELWYFRRFMRKGFPFQELHLLAHGQHSSR